MELNSWELAPESEFGADVSPTKAPAGPPQQRGNQQFMQQSNQDVILAAHTSAKVEDDDCEPCDPKRTCLVGGGFHIYDKDLHCELYRNVKDRNWWSGYSNGSNNYQIWISVYKGENVNLIADDVNYIWTLSVS
ncbi:unnamed protein product [Cylicocyclus nassatus]|uniref:Uncharacterized protein n=1 Tax=Cylicocyclus nassatus TaxID=53992 RepID=A0AA36DRB4_CYLNA|nr:unnamed protein product [Cylicocyclus nassatus]